jgi:hypothetical protein
VTTWHRGELISVQLERTFSCGDGQAKIFHKRVRIYPRHTECEVADTLASYSNQSISLTAVMALTELRGSTEPKSAVNADSITRERVHE